MYFWLKLLTSQISQFSRLLAAVSAVDFLTKIIDQSGRLILTASCCRSAEVFLSWLKFYNCAVLPWKSILFSANFHGALLTWVPLIFWLKLLTSQIGLFSWHLAALRAVVFYAKRSLITLPYCHDKAYFSLLIFTANSCRECQRFFDKNYCLVSWANSHGTLLLWVPWFFFFLLKSYNCAVLPWKSILFSANFHSTQLPRVPWIFG